MPPCLCRQVQGNRQRPLLLVGRCSEHPVVLQGASAHAYVARLHHSKKGGL